MANNPALQTLFGPPDPNASPLTIVELVNLLNQLVTTQFSPGQPPFQPYVISPSTPGVDQRGLVWIQTDSVGRPLAIKLWVDASSAWRRVYNGMAGEIRMYAGDPTVDFPTNSKGVVGGTYDGWALCDGNNGTPDLSDKFIIVAHMNNANNQGYQNGEWVSYIDPTRPQASGGIGTVTLDQAHTYSKGFQVSRWSANGNAADAAGDLYGLPAPNQAPVIQIIPDNQTPPPIDALPPFIALGYIIFIGY